MIYIEAFMGGRGKRPHLIPDWFFIIIVGLLRHERLPRVLSEISFSIPLEIRLVTRKHFSHFGAFILDHSQIVSRLTRLAQS